MAGVLQALIAEGVNPVIELGANKNVVSTGGAGSGTGVVRLNADGTWVGTASPAGSGGFSSTWVLPTYFASAAFEARSTTTVGGPGTTDPSAGAWVALNVDRIWSKLGSLWTFTLEIRRASDLVVLDSCTVSLTGS